MDQVTTLLKTADIYCAATGLSHGRVATLVFNDGKKFDLLRAGRDIGTRTFGRAMQWFADNWPEGADRPAALVDWLAYAHVAGVRPAPESEAAHG